MPRPSRTSPRELGSVYTPRSIAEGMVRACLDCWCEANSIRVGSAARGAADCPGCRILDPACGDGSFLLAAFDELAHRVDCRDRSPAENRLQIVRDQLFGVDLDPGAITSLRTRLLERIDPPDDWAPEAMTAVERNIRCGNALTGPDFSARNQLERGVGIGAPSSHADAFAWHDEFPALAKAGGFDVIVGNPPYLRERNAKTFFDGLAATPIGRRWREARMDLWHYFVHRGLDLLRPGGILSYIVNSYWMSSRGAGRLIERLRNETSFQEIHLLNAAPIFKSVTGRHMIFRLRKHDPADHGPDSPLADRDRLCHVITAIGDDSPQFTLAHHELFQEGRLVVAKPVAEQEFFLGKRPLGEAFTTRQGIAENPPSINRRLLQEFPGQFQLGDGVFVLVAQEIENLNLTDSERMLLRPYYRTLSIGRFKLPDQPTHQLLYLTRQTAPTLDRFPSVRSHLARFRPILERRREVQLGRCAWWHLHWPRDEHLFLRPKILSVQMGRRPQFVFSPRPAFVGFSVNLITSWTCPGVSLEILTGILNSEFALRWFERHAKRRGVNLEINAHVLRQFPLPVVQARLGGRIGELVCARHAAVTDSQVTRLEQEIESLVRRLYGCPESSR